MSSSPPFLPSSPLSLSTGPRRKSRFTYKHLNLLSQSSASSPLRVVAHIDLDAFYAQCEGVRLNIGEDQPLAVQVCPKNTEAILQTTEYIHQQWSGLIAINYPARNYGIKRFTTIGEAKKSCPHIILQHVATWKEGDERWAYHKDAFAHMDTHKVSLDPYRLESRRILACIKDVLPSPPIQRVEKASVDEVFLDLSSQVHSVLLERHPELSGPAPYDDPTENLPRPPTTALHWDTDALVDLDNTETEDDDPDWDDLAMLIGSEIVRTVRAAIRERLQYTCSAGVARNKMLAKLGSAHKKPNQQTIVRNRAVQHFLGDFKFTKIRNLGGKLGEEIASKFATEEIKELLPVSIEQLKAKLGDDTGSWVYHIIRGEDSSEVNFRTQIKSMLSAKSFRPSINTSEQAVRWMRIFVADIYSRLVEEGVVENRRRPKTINLHHRQGAQMRSRQAAIPSGRHIDEALLFDIAQNLLKQIVVDGRAWPCSNLQLSVGGFEDGPTKNRGIGGFLVRGDEAKAMMPTMRETANSSSELQSSVKRRKLDSGAMERFLTQSETSHEESGVDDGTDERAMYGDDDLAPLREEDGSRSNGSSGGLDVSNSKINDIAGNPGGSPEAEGQIDKLQQASPANQQTQVPGYVCSKCRRSVPTHEKEEHEDWHFAKNLQANEAHSDPITDLQAQSSARTLKQSHGPRAPGAFKRTAAGRPSANNVPSTKAIEKGQKRLAFG